VARLSAHGLAMPAMLRFRLWRRNARRDAAEKIVFVITIA